MRIPADKKNPAEEHSKDPFNHYGKNKWLAEMELEKWHRTHPDWNINILRPTVIFGERNRGNVYNLLNLSFSQFCTYNSE